MAVGSRLVERYWWVGHTQMAFSYETTLESGWTRSKITNAYEYVLRKQRSVRLRAAHIFRHFGCMNEPAVR